ncbi:MAG TPA: capsule assembly Wzi family protein [Terriglobales bacterium]|nr:capsule assembly Wzi family protein [Terriglobales bacterium]
MLVIRNFAVGLILSVFLQSAMWAQESNTKDAPPSPGAQSAQQDSSGTEARSQNKLVLSNPFNDAKSRKNNSYELEPGADPENRLIVPFVKHLATDQYLFWTAPAHFQFKDMEWIAPFAGITAGFMAGDSWISKQVPLGEVNRSKTFSNYATYSLIGAGAGSFLLGHLRGDDHMSEAGLLSGEAAINSTAVTYLFKSIAQRPRPYQANGNGTFFQGGSSFPSEHSAIAWSVASVMAHEYPGTLTKILAYGLATGVSATRVTGQQHFASDVIIGSALGWYFGRQVYRAHHDTDLGGDSWGTFLPESSGEKTRNPENMGSPDVPLDSWVYPALERLIALGYIKTAYIGIRPWTRMECARMLEEAEERIGDEDAPTNDQALRIYKDLSEEFSPETGRRNGAANLGASLDSIYVRGTEVSGPPLRDGYHFGQTIINDYGRPYARGFNSVDGITAHAEAGPLSIAIQGEYQHAPAITSEPLTVLQAIANADFTTSVSDARRRVDRLDLLEGTVSITLHNAQLSFGKQSQWLGPGESGSLLMSDNAEPVVMLKFDSVSPYEIPLLSHFLGPVRVEYFLAQLAGHQFELNGNQLLGPGGISPQPFLDGGKFNFRPTSNLEIGMGFTAQFGGPGLPLTFDNFIRTFYVHTQNTSTTTGNNPAKRATNADFSYRVPGLRDWLTIYGDALTVDEISPVGSTRATVNPGVYVPQLPKLHNLQFRAEGINEPLTKEFAPGFVYYGVRRYRSGYTNNGNLMGNWIGRAGRGVQSWVTYSVNPRSQLQLGYRLQEVSHLFLGGGRSTDLSATADIALSNQLSAAGFVQYEHWRFPTLAPNMQSDLSAGFQLTFRPKLQVHK